MNGQSVLVVGRGSGIARAISDAARAAGAMVINAGRDVEALTAAYPGERVEPVDLTDDASIAALAARVGPVDHIVSTAADVAEAALLALGNRFLTGATLHVDGEERLI